MSQIIQIFNDSSSLTLKLIFLASVILHILIIVLSIRRKPLEGVTKGKVWITYLVSYWLLGSVAGTIAGAALSLILQGIFYILSLFNYNHPTEITIYTIAIVVKIITGAITFAVLNKKYLTSKDNIAREENTTTKQYILLILKLIGIGMLILFAIPLIAIFIAGYLVFKVLGIGNFIGNAAVNRVREVHDDIDIHTYERQRYSGNVQPHERIISDSEAEEIKERIKKRNQIFK